MSNKVLSLSKALTILKLFSKEEKELRISEICTRLELPASTVHRLLATLEYHDFIVQNQINGKYRLGAAAFIVGANVSDINTLVDASLPYIAALSNKFHAPTHLAIEQNGHVLCIEKIEHQSHPVTTPPRGYKHKMHMTSVGKCILAFSSSEKRQALIESIKYERKTSTTIMNSTQLHAELVKIRNMGYSIDYHESDDELFCFGAPVFNNKNQIVAAISLSIKSELIPDNYLEIIDSVITAAKNISLCLKLEKNNL